VDVRRRVAPPGEKTWGFLRKKTYRHNRLKGGVWQEKGAGSGHIGKKENEREKANPEAGQLRTLGETRE